MTFTQFTEDNKVVPGFVLIGPDGEPYKASFQVVEGGTIDTDVLAKEAKQDTGNASLSAIDSKLGGTLNAAITAASLPLPNGAASSANQNTIITALNNEYALLGAGINVTVQNASLPVTVASLPLPAGAATSAKQDALQSSIDDGIDVVVSNTVPVTMANRAVTVSNPVEISNTSIGINDGGGSITVDGTVAATQSGTWTSTLAPDATVAVSGIGSPVAVTDNGGSLTVDGTVGVSGTVQSNITNASIPVTDNGGSLTVDAVSLPLPTGAATEATLASLNTAAGIVSASGTIAALNDSVVITPGSRDTLLIQVTGTFTATLTVQGTVDGTNWIQLGGIINVNNSTSSGTISGVGIYQIGVSGYTQVRLISLAAVTGSASVSMRVTPGAATVALDAPVTISGTVATTATTTPASLTAFALTSAATTNATLVKNAGGNLFEVTVSNPTATATYLKLYNKASAPTVGTDTPLVILPVSANSISVLSWDGGKRFSAGIAYAITGAIGVSDTSVAVAGVIVSGSYL